jgi:hypothetical protein
MFALLALTIPFVVSILAAWAWSWRGIVAGIAGGAVLAFLFSLTKSLMDAREAEFHFKALNMALIFVVWLMGLIPGSFIGLSIRAIAKRRLGTPNKTIPISNSE